MITPKFEVLLRMRAIELLAYWEGRLITNQVMESFGVSRQQASNDIRRYNTEYNPKALIHDPSVKGYVPSNGFQPKLTTGHINEYMDMVSGLLSQSTPLTIVPDGHLASVQLPERAVKPEVVQKIIAACRGRRSLQLNYASMNHPEGTERIISPHTLVYTGFRWHARAFCHENKQHRDFILSRINGVPNIVNEELEFHGAEEDADWQEEIELVFIANPGLSESQQSLVQRDFAMSNGKLKIQTKKSLAHYTIQRYQAALVAKPDSNPKEVPLIVEKGANVNALLFGAG
jgi:predicted DNA-binding transcriptional regulator YafY